METNKYLFLKFRNAGYFPDQSRTKDFMFDLDGKRKRSEHIQYVEPITVHHISNMLHVLMGERPKASLRKTLIERNENIFNLANNGYLKIDTILTFNKSKDIYEFPSETITIRKSVFNSFSPAPDLIYWERVKRLLEDDLYSQFINMMNDILNTNVVEKYTCVDAVKMLRDGYRTDKRVTDFLIILKDNSKQPMIDFIVGGQKASKALLEKNPLAVGPNATFNSNARTLITTNFGVDKIVRLCGEIIIPMSESDVEKIRQNKGTAKLLDGGLVWISKLLDETEINNSMLGGFTEIKNLSTETKKTKK